MTINKIDSSSLLFVDTYRPKRVPNVVLLCSREHTVGKISGHINLPGSVVKANILCGAERGLFLTLNKLHRYYKNESVELVLAGRVWSRRCIANINFTLPTFKL